MSILKKNTLPFFKTQGETGEESYFKGFKKERRFF